MTALVWDQVGERRYETGVDRGVLYLSGGVTVPWNGLISVVESRGRDVTSYFMDGVKYMDNQTPGTYSAKLQAFTYPDELDAVLGNGIFAPGVIVYDQKGSRFNLSYRTRVANDLEGPDNAYKIHIVYNVRATPTDVSYATLSDSPSANSFEWDLTATPERVAGIRPTSHISFDSRHFNPSTLVGLEELIYGTPTVNPQLPTMAELLSMVTP